MKILSICPESFAANTYALISGEHAIIVDPSVSVEAITSAVEAEGAGIETIILTHGHFDHIMSIDTLRRATGARVMIHRDDAEMLTDAHKNAYATFTGQSFVIGEADVVIKEGDTIPLGDELITVIHTPGHTRGSVCYDTGDCLITGDTIFAEGFGRYDLYGGDIGALKQSIKRLTEMAQAQSRWIYPGHGGTSTLRQAAENLKYYF